jgi:LuxR family maltose regulon positive regulatory protein
MATLLQAAATRRIAPDYARRLLTGFGTAEERLPASHAPVQPLVEALSERELEVLRLLATDLDGPEIASQLMVSLNTMRTHTKNIFSKLGVNNRRAAVRRAEELQLVSETSTR